MVVRLRGFSDYLLAIPLALPGALTNRALVTGIPRRLGVGWLAPLGMYGWRIRDYN